MANKYAYLVMVEADANNNKFYRMTQLNESAWEAEWGRIEGGRSQKQQYSMGEWDKKYREKTKKGYEDKTHLYAEKVVVAQKGAVAYKPIPDRVVAEIVRRLQQMAKEAISENYTITVDKVTQAMIDEAESLIHKLGTVTKDLDKFNEVLVQLFKTIPRKMKKVQDELLKDLKDIPEFLQHEQDLLDVMKGQVAVKSIEEKSDSVEGAEKTILEVMGLEIKPVVAADVKLIKETLGGLAHRYHDAWKVVNIKTQAAFDKFVKDNKIKETKLLWHGSRNENWWSILRTGLVLRPNAVITGKMFGNGIYFANKAEKSLGYSSLSGSYWAKGNSPSGFMSLYDTAYGIPYFTYSFDSKYYNYNWDALQRAQGGAHCLHAKADRGMLRNDEIIYYKEDQMTVKYLVELK